MLQFKDTSLCWGRSVNRLLEREEYKTHYENIMYTAAAMPKNNAFLVAGTPGVGKTMFGWWLLYELIRTAVVNGDDIFIVYKGLHMSQYAYMEITAENGAVFEYHDEYYHLDVDFVVLDSVDATNTKIHVKDAIYIDIGSDKNANVPLIIKEWGIKMMPTAYGTMKPFSEEEILAFSTSSLPNTNVIPREILLGLFDFFGGNAHSIMNVVGMIHLKLNPGFLIAPLVDSIYTVAKEFFEFEESDPVVLKTSTTSSSSDSSSSTSKWHKVTMKDLFQRAAAVMAAGITSQGSTFAGLKRPRDANPTLEVSSSLFIHHYNSFQYEWASPFMAYYAGYVTSENVQGVLQQLRTILTNSGIGGMHEYRAHQYIYQTLKDPNNSLLLESLDGSAAIASILKLKLSTPLVRKRMIRKISDLALLRNGEYGMPSVTNFPLIDAAVGPNFVFQVTISKSYAKAEQNIKLDEIRSALNSQTLIFVFVLETANYSKFKPLSNIPPQVHQYKLCCDLQPTAVSVSKASLQSLAAFHGISYTTRTTPAKLWKDLQDAGHL